MICSSKSAHFFTQSPSAAVYSPPARLQTACSSQELQEISTGSDGRSLNSLLGEEKKKNSDRAIGATSPSAGDPGARQAEHSNIWHSERAADPNRSPGISRATPVYGCRGICQSATFQSRGPSVCVQIASMCSGLRRCTELGTRLPQDGEEGRSSVSG